VRNDPHLPITNQVLALNICRGTLPQVTSYDTLSEQSLQQAERWLHKCLESHDTCKTTSLAISWYPTRLLYLDKSNEGLYCVRLIFTAQEQPQGPYATLSHRWGEADFIKLTRHTLASFRGTIPVGRLPKTFMDAISVSLQLGVRYLWIDSLCIMQDRDDLSDWLHEASLMQKVYSYCYFNISASVAKEGSEGLSRYRNPSKLYSPIVGLHLRNVRPSTDIVDFEIICNELWTNNVAHCLLNTRGWVSILQYKIWLKPSRSTA
jgi:hypothetical protein